MTHQYVQELMALHDAAVAAAISVALERKGDRDVPTRAALESALRLALAAREGFVMVPVEPTPDMLEAGAGTKYEKRARNVWRDMIAAAAPKGTT